MIEQIDHLLRNHEDVIEAVQDESTGSRTTGYCYLIFVILSALYGLIMGSFSLMHGYNDGVSYALAAFLKLPVLFLATLAICLPLLYVLNVLIGARAPFKVVFGVLGGSLAVTSILLASCALILAFFMLSTKNYAFIWLLNVGIFTLAGLYGVWFLGKAMRILASKGTDEESVSRAANVKTIIRWWLITFGIVGTQMAWLMRPFIGSPGVPFTFFRPQDSNFYIALIHSLTKLLGG